MYSPVRVGLEAVAAQSALVYPFREAMRRENVKLPLVELKGGFSTRKKEFRIQSLHEFFANGSLWLNKAHTELLEELRAYPAVTHDDMLDALAYAMQLLVYPSPEMQEPMWAFNSFEAIRRELGLKQNAGTGPFLFAGERPAPVLGWNRIPQSVEEIQELLQREVG